MMNNQNLKYWAYAFMATAIAATYSYQYEWAKVALADGSMFVGIDLTPFVRILIPLFGDTLHLVFAGQFLANRQEKSLLYVALVGSFFSSLMLINSPLVVWSNTATWLIPFMLLAVGHGLSYLVLRLEYKAQSFNEQEDRRIIQAIKEGSTGLSLEIGELENLINSQHTGIAEMIKSLLVMVQNNSSSVDTSEIVQAVHAVLPAQVGGLPQPKPAKGLSDEEIIAWMQCYSWIVAISTDKGLYEMFGVSPAKFKQLKERV